MVKQKKEIEKSEECKHEWLAASPAAFFNFGILTHYRIVFFCKKCGVVNNVKLMK